MEKVLKGSGLVYQRLDRQIVVYRLLGHNACRVDYVRVMTNMEQNDR